MMNDNLFALEEMILNEIDFQTRLIRMPSKTDVDFAHDLSGSCQIQFLEKIIRELHKISEQK